MVENYAHIHLSQSRRALQLGLYHKYALFKTEDLGCFLKHTHLSGSFVQWGPDQSGDLRSSLQPSRGALLPQSVQEFWALHSLLI